MVPAIGASIVQPTRMKFTSVTALPAPPAELSDDTPLWWTVLVEGVYPHAKYGEVRITRERLARMDDNFHRGVYGQDLPLNLNHQTGDQGAAGWINDVRLIEEGGRQKLQLSPRLNSYGKMLVGDERVKYLSAEFWDRYPTFAHGEVEDLFGGAGLTERPHMKNLGAISLTEDGAAGLPMLYIEEEPVMSTEPKTANATPPTPATPTTAAVLPPPPPPPGMVTLEEFQEEQRRRETAERAAEEAKQIAVGERVRRELREATQSFMDLDLGDGYRLVGATAADLADLAMDLAGEPPRDDKGQVLLTAQGQPQPSKRQRFVALVGEIGKGIVATKTKGFAAEAGAQTADQSPNQQFDRLVHQRMTEAKEPYDKACEHVMAEHPELAAQAMATE